MIDPKELRIGNAVSSIALNIPIGFVFKFRNDNIVCSSRNKGFVVGSIKSFDPIPLTPEVLENCGFEYRDGYYINGVLFSMMQQDGSEQIIIGSPGSGIPTKTKHLHQLQNLFFVLTGKELTINL